MKSLKLVALAAVLSLVTAGAAFAQVSEVANATLASGSFARSDHNQGHWTVIGTYSPTQSSELFHFVDGYNDVTCAAKETARDYTDVTFTPTSCWPTALPNSPVTIGPNPQIKFWWGYGNLQSGFILAAHEINLDLPGLCIYNSFTGTGYVNAP